MLKKSTTTGKFKSLSNGSSASLLSDFSFSNNEWDNKEKYIQPKQQTLEELKEHLSKIPQIKRDIENILYVSSKNEWFWSELIEELYFQTERVNAQIRKLSVPKNKSSATSVSDEEILRAKQFPLTSLLQFKHLTLVCPFHSERTGSLYYYAKTNTAHCFGACGKTYDSIEVYKLLNKCTFVQAVKALQ